MKPNVKLKKFLMKYTPIYAVWLLIFALWANIYPSITLLTICGVLSIPFFLLATLFATQSYLLKKASSSLEVNRLSATCAIDFDGKNAYLYQQMKVRKAKLSDFKKCFSKKYDTYRPLEVEELDNIVRDMQLVVAFLQEHPDVHLETLTHGRMANIFREFFELQELSTEEISSIRWTFISVHARGIVLNKPDVFTNYRLTLPQTNEAKEAI